MPFPTKVKRCTESLQSLFSLYLLYLFVEVYAILVLRFIRPSYLGREVYLMIHILTILESVVADVMSHYICKWLDRFDKDRKPD